MNTIQNVIIALFVFLCATLPCILASAQDVPVYVGSEYVDVEVKKGFTDVCTRVDAHTLTCTRFEGGKATNTFTVKL